MRDHLVAVDIGTGSARAGIFHRDGTLLAKATVPIAMQNPFPNHAEHDSENIWDAVTASVREARAMAGIAMERIAAIGFDATCSLVVRGLGGEQLSVSTTGESRFDTLVWMDHRALAEADELTETRHAGLASCGGRMSPEMQLPKLMWLKRHLPGTWAKAGGIYDLSDYMTFRATGSPARSCSTLASKWTFDPHRHPGWKRDFLALAGLDDLHQRAGLPEGAMPVGASLGPLAPEAALELGLDTSCVVAPGMVDAYAGALGLLGGHADDPDELERHVALIAGTSSCIVRLARKALPAAGYWGPYCGVCLPDFFLMEGGQSAAGAVLDHIVLMHAAGGNPEPERHAGIIKRILELQAVEGETFGRPLDVLADFHGNRSPLGDPHATGTIAGLSLDRSFDGLCRLYWRTAVGIACGIRHILASLPRMSSPPHTLHIAGGHARNPLLVSLYADMTGYRVLVPTLADTVLLGTAMNAAAAAGLYRSVAAAGVAMCSDGIEQMPDPDRQAFHEKDYQRFLVMMRHRAELSAMP